MKKSRIYKTDDCSTHFEALGSDAIKHINENKYNEVVLFIGDVKDLIPIDSNIDQIKQLFKIRPDKIFDVIIYHYDEPSIHVFTN